MNTKKNFFEKLGKSLKELVRKFFVTLKKNPNYIPFVMLIASFLVYSLNLTYISNTTATVQGKGMGLFEFATMLFSILSMICVLNAFPKRQKPNYPMVALIIFLFAIIITSDVIYFTNVAATIEKLGDNIKPATLEEYLRTQNVLIAHIALTVITGVTVVLEPVFAKLLKKINTSVELEETNVGNIELSDEE
jgi:hypothetical protein